MDIYRLNEILTINNEIAVYLREREKKLRLYYAFNHWQINFNYNEHCDIVEQNIEQKVENWGKNFCEAFN